MLLTRSPLSTQSKSSFSFDLHALSTPLAFILSQDQTLRLILLPFLRMASLGLGGILILCMSLSRMDCSFLKQAVDFSTVSLESKNLLSFRNCLKQVVDKTVPMFWN